MVMLYEIFIVKTCSKYLMDGYTAVTDKIILVTEEDLFDRYISFKSYAEPIIKEKISRLPPGRISCAGSRHPFANSPLIQRKIGV
jgi:hypothetical protein